MRSQDALELFRTMIYDIKCKITSTIDVLRSPKNKHQTYPYCCIPHVSFPTPEYRDHVLKLKKIRESANQISETLIKSQQIKFDFAFANAIAQFGIGECGECTHQLVVDFLHSELFNHGSLLQIMLVDGDNNHEFAIYFPDTIQMFQPKENTSFSAWLQAIPHNIREQMILVDPWRYLVQSLSDEGIQRIIQSLKIDYLNTVHRSAFFNRTISAKNLQQWEADTKLIFQKMCLLPEIAAFQHSDAVKIQDKPRQVVLLNEKCTHLSFFAQQRPGYFVDAVAEIDTPQKEEEALALQSHLNTGHFHTQGQKFFTVRNINVSNGPFGNGEKINNPPQYVR